MNPSSTLGESAILYASRGWPVFPLVPGTKTPATPHGFRDATTDVDITRERWASLPNANIGIATGHRFDVLDVDQIGYREDSLDAFGLGPTVVTPSGGFHVYFLPWGRNRVRFAAGADWRGLGGYVVAPPSRSARGRWEWVHADLAIPPIPDWLQRALSVPATPVRPGRDPSAGEMREPSRYGQGALRSAERIIRDAPEGRRNHILNYEAFRLTRLVAEGLLTAEEVKERLAYAAQEAGLPYREVERTLWSAFRGSPWLQ